MNLSVRSNQFLLWITLISIDLVHGFRLSRDNNELHNISLRMHGAQPLMDDHYMCSIVLVPDYETVTTWITAFYPNNIHKYGHHMSVEGCSDVDPPLQENTPYDSDILYDACKDYQVILRWAKNAPPTEMPKGVGFKIGKGSKVKYLLLTIHYKHTLPEGVLDYSSGYNLVTTTKRQRYMAGILHEYITYFEIPPLQPEYGVNTQCVIQAPSNFTIFAARVHSHNLGVVVSAYKHNLTSSKFEFVHKGNPNWPQSFYPVRKPVLIQPNEIFTIRCLYSSTTKLTTTTVGEKDSNEMCVVDSMYYTDPDYGTPYIDCARNVMPILDPLFPDDVDQPMKRNKLLEDIAKGKNNGKMFRIHYPKIQP